MPLVSRNLPLNHMPVVYLYTSPCGGFVQPIAGVDRDPIQYLGPTLVQCLQVQAILGTQNQYGRSSKWLPVWQNIGSNQVSDSWQVKCLASQTTTDILLCRCKHCIGQGLITQPCVKNAQAVPLDKICHCHQSPQIKPRQGLNWTIISPIY